MTTSLFKHQAQHVAEHWDKKAYGMWWQMGTGKTAALLNVARQLFHTGRIGGMIVVAPSEVYLNWLAQVRQHAPEMSAVAWESSNPVKSNKNIEWLGKWKGPKVLLINVEALGRDRPKALYTALGFIEAAENVMLTVDESSCIKNPKAKSVKNVLVLAKYCTYRRALNGTPGVESPFDVWQQLEFLEPGCTRYNYYMFTKTYGIWQKAYYGPRSFDQCVGYRNIDQLRKLLEAHGQFILKEECLDLPPKLYETFEFDMPAPVMAAYHELRKKRVLELNGTLITNDSALMIAIQLHNIATGFVRHDDKTAEWISQARIDALLSLLEQISEKAVIFCNSRPGLLAINAALVAKYGPESTRLVYGDVEPVKRVQYIREFQGDPDVRFFVSNQQTAGRGVTLTAAQYVIYFRNGYSLEQRLQSEDRAHRIGQTKSVTIIDIVARGTIDVRIVDLLQQKQDVAAQLLGLVKEELLV